MSKSINISNSVIRRLPRYYRFLGELEDQQISKISSRELSERMHLTASQKDRISIASAASGNRATATMFRNSVKK